MEYSNARIDDKLRELLKVLHLMPDVSNTDIMDMSRFFNSMVHMRVTDEVHHEVSHQVRMENRSVRKKPLLG